MESSLWDDDGGRVATTLGDAPQDHSPRVVRGGEDVSAPADPRRVAEFAVFGIGFGDGHGIQAASVKLKRKRKMAKHKHRKRRKRDRNKN